MRPAAGTVVARQEVDGLVFSSLVYEPGAALGWHEHTHPYLSFVGRGSYTERLPGLSRECGATTLLLHPAGERHANLFHAEAVTLLRLEATGSKLLDLPMRAATSSGCRGEASRSLCRRLLDELHAPDDVTPIALQGLAFELVAQLARASTAPSAREPAWLDPVDELLRDRFHERLSLSAIATIARVHPVHLAKTYRRHRDRTIGERIRELRLEHACRLLATTRQTVAEIAQSCGFADQSHLGRLMRRRLGVSPARYRAQRTAR
jgi:AraC family transcriptional regulator